MTDKGRRHFSVQRCDDPSALIFGPPKTIEGASALEAAQQMLGQALSLFGERQDLAGRVLQLNDDDRSAATMVFYLRSDVPQPTHSPELDELQAMRDRLAKGVADAEASLRVGLVPMLGRYDLAERKDLIARIDADILKLRARIGQKR